jgi:hypothetical protein
MSDRAKLRHALLDRIQQKSEEVGSSIDSLLKSMEAIPPAERVGPDWGPDGTLAKRFLELSRMQADLAGKLILGSAAIDRSGNDHGSQ